MLDALQQTYGLKLADVASGSSAGIGSLAYFAAGNFYAGFWEDFLSSKEFMGIGNLIRRGKPYVNIDYLIDSLVKEKYPLDVDAVLGSGMELIVPLTDSDTGEVSYLTNTEGFDGCNFFDVLKASMALPLPLISYGKNVLLKDRAYFDGGYGDPLPVDHPKIKDTRKIIVLTKNKNYPLEDTWLEKAITEIFRPMMKEGVYRQIKRNSELYMEKLEKISEYEKNGDIVIRPKYKLNGLNNSRKNLRNCIELGRKDLSENEEVRMLMGELMQSERRNFYFGQEAEFLQYA